MCIDMQMGFLSNAQRCILTCLHIFNIFASSIHHIYIMSTSYIRHTYIIHIYGAASPRRRPPPHGMPPPKPRLSFQQIVIRHPRNCPPKLGLAPWPTGGSGSTWNHKTGNHRGGVGKDNPQHREPQGPFPFPSSSTHRR